MDFFSSVVIGVFFVSTILLSFEWFMLLRQFSGNNVHAQSSHIKDLPLVASVLFAVVGLLTLTRGNEYVHKYVLSGPVGNGVVMAHLSLATFLISVAWFDGFNHMTELNPHYKMLNYRTLKNNMLPTFTLVSTYVLYGIVKSANYVNCGMMRDDDSVSGRRVAVSAKGGDRWDGSYTAEPQTSSGAYRTRVVYSS
jgi:hypothetical protein